MIIGCDSALVPQLTIPIPPQHGNGLQENSNAENADHADWRGSISISVPPHPCHRRSSYDNETPRHHPYILSFGYFIPLTCLRVRVLSLQAACPLRVCGVK